MRYADSRVYTLPGSLSELQGPASGIVTLPTSLDWSEQHVYDLGDLAQAGLMYERVIREATTASELASYLNGELLARLWGRLYLPARARLLWEGKFVQLARAA